MDESLGPPTAAERVAPLAQDSAFELILTFVLLFGVTSIVRWVTGPSLISRVIPQINVELLIVGAAVALLRVGLILTPPGRASGGHMNPAISFAMWCFGVFRGRGSAVYHSPVARLPYSACWPPVQCGVRSWPGRPCCTPCSARTDVVDRELFAAGPSLWPSSCSSSGSVAVPRLAPFVPWVVRVQPGWPSLLGRSTEQLNPARQFGPAAVSGQTHFLWVYLLAPMLGH
jgi:glycerol uptake facilitator protein/aquaporin Z